MIRAPKENHEDYFNRKRYYRFILQGIVAASGAYLSVSTGFPGSMHDARVLRLSNFFFHWGREGNIDHALHWYKWDTNSAPHIRRFSISTQVMANASLSGQWSSDGSSPSFQQGTKQSSNSCRTKARWRCLDKRIGEETMTIPHTVTAS